MLEYQVRSAQRILGKKERLYEAEKLIFDFFKNINGADSKLAHQQKIIILQHAINKLFKQSFEQGFIFYFDIVSWVESQSSNKPFATIVLKTATAAV